MSLLDPVFALFTAADAEFARALPAVVRLVIWATLGAVASLELYRLVAPQARLRGVKQSLRQAQLAVANFDGEFAEGSLLVRRMLRLALQRVWMVFPATLIASLPLLLLILWLAITFGSSYPAPGTSVAVEAPGALTGRWIEADAGNRRPGVQVSAPSGEVVARVNLDAPIPIIAKRRWWNIIIGNPAGYLPDDAPFDAVAIGLPRQEYLKSGPAWLRGWEAIFLPSLVLSALGYKFLRRIE